MIIWLIQRAEPTPIDNNGNQRILRTGIIAEKLSSLGHKVIWWTSTFDHYSKRHRFKKSTLIDININYQIYFIKSIGYKYNFSIWRIFDLAYLTINFNLKLNKLQSKPDIIISSIPSIEMTYFATKFAKKYKIPIYVDIRDLWPDVFLDLIPKYLIYLIKSIVKPYKYFNKITLIQATGLIALTQEFLNWGLIIAERNQMKYDIVVPMGYFQNKVKISNQIVDKLIFINDFKLQRDDNYLTITFAGTIGKMFDFNPIIKAANYFLKSSIKIRFIICGTGDKLNELKKKCNLITNIYFTSWITKDELTTIYQLSDLAIAPYINSINFNYNIPNKPAEYLSHRLPILLSLDIGPLKKIITINNCGFTYSNDMNILIDQILLLNNNRIILNKMSENANSVYLKSFQGDNVYDKLVHHLNL